MFGTSNLLKKASELAAKARESAAELAQKAQAEASHVAEIAKENSHKLVLLAEEKAKALQEEAKASHRQFLEEKAKYTQPETRSLRSRLPWEPVEEDDAVFADIAKERILLLSCDEKTFLEDPPGVESFNFDIEEYVEVCVKLMEIDENLRNQQRRLSLKVPETKFWKNYFFRCQEIRQQVGLLALPSPERAKSKNTDEKLVSDTMGTSQSATPLPVPPHQANVVEMPESLPTSALHQRDLATPEGESGVVHTNGTPSLTETGNPSTDIARVSLGDSLDLEELEGIDGGLLEGSLDGELNDELEAQLAMELKALEDTKLS